MDNTILNAKPVELRRLPSWMKRKKTESEKVIAIKRIIKEKGLHSVCQSAGCPNISECFEKPTATFMILGNTCTRNCRFCGVPTGKPESLDELEPLHVAEAVKTLGLRHVVITSVTRDDLADGGAEHFYKTITEIKRLNPDSTTEALIPDFRGDSDSLRTVLSAGLDILNHNVETVPRLYPEVRPQADFQRSLNVLKNAKLLKPDILVKSGLMVGLGETEDELKDVFVSLTDSGCDILTIGQYLSPSVNHYPIAEFITPEKFKRYEILAKECGIKWVSSGPFVRSSYNAEELMNQIRNESNG
ncbi:lipoyl synthase [candidate division KSB1 bacterium]|nr:MAG: lipoyl synthase [candidate division KSB1 bacterium]